MTIRDRSDVARRWLGRAALLALIVLLGWASLPATARAADHGAAIDPVVRDVVGLLEAEMGEALILRWLEDGDRHPAAPLAATDLVALKSAGASDELIAALLDRAVAVETLPEPAPGPAPEPTPRPAAAAAPAPEPTPQPAPSPPPATAAPMATGEVPATLTARYVHGLDEEEAERGAWSFVVYLDGAPSPALWAAGPTKATPTWSETRALAPGHHVVRWAQERERKGRGGSVLREARFDPEPLPFELAPGEAATIDVEFRDRSGIFARFGGPMTVRVTQGERELAARETNDDPAHWPLLCEEIEAGLGGRDPGWDERRQLKHCVRWSELWPGLDSVPGRDEARPKLR